MIKFEFDLEKQKLYYKSIKDRIKRGVYKDIDLYVLPYLPEKFRNRVIFFPRECRPEEIYKKNIQRINQLKIDFGKTNDEFIFKIKEYFPEVDDLNIVISPILYGSTGQYNLSSNEIEICPRFDKNIHTCQRLIVLALTHYFEYPNEFEIDEPKKWKEKQLKAVEIQKKIFVDKNVTPMTKILDSNMAGKLAEESARYQEELGVKYKPKIDLSNLNLTKKQRKLFNLLLINKNKLVTNDQIADSIWEEGEEDKYSLYAISTLVKKLRKKLKEKTGKNLIHSQRSVGYILYI